MTRGSSRRSGGALALSLVLHAAVALFLFFQESPKPPAARPSGAIEVQITELLPPPPAAQPEPQKPVMPPAPVKKKATSAAPAPVAVAPGAPSAEPAAPAAPSGARAPDSPKSITLVPGSDFVVKQGGGGLEPEAPRGHTVVNSPQERPDPVAMREYTEEKLGRRTGAMVGSMVADVQAKNGLVDPYFTGARRALEGDLSAGNVPLPKDKNLAREGVKGYLKSQENFGKTGNPFAPGTEPKWDDHSLARNQTQGMAMQNRDAEWGAMMRQTEQSMAASEATMRATDHAILEAVLELVQEPGGGIADAHIVKSSGYPGFDEYVLHRARKVFLTLDDPPETGHGITSAGWRTLWKFSYWPVSISERRGQRVRVELLRVEKGQGSGNPLEHVPQ
ncbi:MAG: energy transducer TonB [Myxococcaceae bacterium]|nr:energy transducer TonB [Myxococcaceae bacterium]